MSQGRTLANPRGNGAYYKFELTLALSLFAFLFQLTDDLSCTQADHKNWFPGPENLTLHCTH